MTKGLEVNQFVDNKTYQSDEVHGPIFPREIRPSDGVSLQIEIDGEGSRAPVLRVWRLSPFGIEFDNETKLGADLNHIKTIVQEGKHKFAFSGVVVFQRQMPGGSWRIGVRWMEKQSAPATVVDKDRRIATRWKCTSEFLPTGMCPNPFRANDFMYFRIMNISKTGMLLVTSLRNRWLVPSLKLQSIISFPGVGQISSSLVIKNIRLHEEGEKGYLALGVSFEETNPSLPVYLGNYLLQFAPEASYSNLKAAGLLPSKRVSTIEVDSVRTEKEFGDVLELRRLSYLASQKIAASTSTSEMTDNFDTYARILIARRFSKPVGSLRIVFGDDALPFEHEESFPWPAQFPPRSEVVEISRTSVNPEFQGTYILKELFSCAAVIVNQARRRWTLASCVPELLESYLKMGFVNTGITYKHAMLNNLEHIVLLGDNYKAVAAEVTGPIIWNSLYREAYEVSSQCGIHQMSPRQMLKIQIYLMIGNVLRLLKIL